MSKMLYPFFVGAICFCLTACGDKTTYIAVAMNVKKPVADIIKDINNGKFDDVAYVVDTKFEKVQGIAMVSDNSCDMQSGQFREASIRVDQADPNILKMTSDNIIGTYVTQGAYSDFTGVLKLIISHSTYNKLLAKCQSAPKAAE